MAGARGPKPKAIREFGDFQTPPDLALAATSLLAKLSFKPGAILEPTCGKGAFVLSAAKAFPDTPVIGFEINSSHLDQAISVVAAYRRRVALHQGDFFVVNWQAVIGQSEGPWLIIGNPPWVTSSELGAIESANLPAKSNFQGHAGLDAITGKANFDISEHMLLKYLEWLEGKPGTVAVLCKTAVARKILLHCWKRPKSQIAEARIYKIDAMAQFGAAVDACFFVVTLEPDGQSRTCEVFGSLEATAPVNTFGYDSGHLIPDIRALTAYRHLLGPERSYVWRSGVKHDCSKVMELKRSAIGLENGLGESVRIEPDFLFPMLKSSDVGNGRTQARSMMLVTQRRVGDPTGRIAREAPLTWAYLNAYSATFDRRGSSIYRNKPPFSIFGVGDYTFAPWKVAISGFYKKLLFLKVGPEDGKPVVFDDTIYFLPCRSEAEADFLLDLLTSKEAQGFYGAMIHWDEKRPVTVDVLKRLDLGLLSQKLGREADYRQYTALPEPMPLDDQLVTCPA